ncbi:MAG: class I SAM-dependent methyltransferase [Anaerolineaceae bacterium]
MTESDDITRLREEYKNRDIRYSSLNNYSLIKPSNLFIYQQRQRIFLKDLNENIIKPFHERSILELGCGNGFILHELEFYGFSPNKIFGVDLMFPRLKQAHQNMTNSSLVNSNGQLLPFKDSHFDMSLQFTAFSSILNFKVKQDMAREILRTINNDGTIFWYDFWVNPINKRTKGIKPKEIFELFPNCQISMKKITLAPPIARIIVPISWAFALFLESIKIFNSHYLAVIKPNDSDFRK